MFYEQKSKVDLFEIYESRYVWGNPSFHSKTIRAKAKHGDGSVMLRGCSAALGLAIVEGSTSN